jgi:hypothetical protein
MWALRILNGPQAGTIYVLKQGRNRLGRNPQCDLPLQSTGISKEHLEIQVAGEKVLVKDLKSSNGTYLNGVRIQTGMVQLGDKIGVDQILFDVIRSPSANAMVLVQPGHHLPGASHPMSPQAGLQGSGYEESASAGGLRAEGFQQRAERYFHEVFLPGLYSLVDVFPFKSVIMGFAISFVLIVTLLSIIPMNQITSESIKTESRRRAQTVARALANSNERAIRNGEMSGYNADLVLRDEGISHVYILGKDGTIIAPPEMVGLTAKDIAGFVAQIKGQTREMAGEVGSGKIAASSPILVFDPEIQQNVAKAHAVVVYDTGSLRFDDGRALGLFVQMLAIALIVGAALFFLMYKVIEYPFIRLNQELDAALREGRDHAHLAIQFPLLQQVLVSVNSLLNRVHQGGSGVSAGASAATRDSEWMNLVSLFGYPALLLSKEMQMVAINGAFESLTGVQAHLVQGQSLAYLPDQALQKNIEELTRSAQSNTSTLHSDRLDIGGHQFQISCQALTVAGEARYYLISISPQEQAEGGAA